MSFDAKVFRVLIASPSDVIDEREITVKTIQEWNDLHSADKQIVLLPLRWETHTSPEFGKRPQEIINRQVVDHCDLVIGIFWTRIGSPTGKKDSGTLEEIDRVATAGKPAMLYFSKVKKEPDDIDLEQLIKLREFKKNTYPKALVENFSSQVEFRDKLSKQIEMQLRTLLTDNEENNGNFESDILLEFTDSKKNIGEDITLKSEYLKLSNVDKLPDYVIDKKNKKEKSSLGVIFGEDKPNKDYYRSLSEYMVTNKLFVPVKFWLKNQGKLGAKDLYIDIKATAADNDVTILSSSQIDLEKPQKVRDHLTFSSSRISYGNSIKIVQDTTSKKEWHISFDLNALQPKREIYPNFQFYVGAKKSTKINFEATIYADSLPETISHSLTIDLNVDVIDVDVFDLLNDLDELPSKNSA